MCGIAGLIDPSVSAEAREQAVLRMCESMIHRGPDDLGMTSLGMATIGMRRLAIFDPANGKQPMSTANGQRTLVFNGAIYNFNDLKLELEGNGWRFRTRCDTEVLLAALDVWGEGALSRLRGMFALALWDAKEESLLLARDPLGIKPLYFSHSGRRLAFASEITPMLNAGLIDGSIDPASVADYLAWFSVPAPRTIYRNVSSMQPGEVLRFSGGKLTARSDWSFAAISSQQRPCSTRVEFIGELRERLNDTIRAHVLADVPVGAFLSGGLDSAVVAGLMSKASGVALKTFTIGFEEDGFSEADEAEETARHLGSIHHTRILTGDEVARDLDKFLAAFDQPSGDGVNTYYVSQTAQEGGVKVALSGLGGDELFGGYPSFRQIPMFAGKLAKWRRLPEPLRKLFIEALRMGTARPRKLADILEFAMDAHDLGALQRRVFSEPRRKSILAPEVACGLGLLSPFHPRLESIRADVPSGDLFSLASAWEIRTYMADVLLRDSDVMGMRHSLELRVPFVDRPLIEWLWNQPAQYKFDPRKPKTALVEATADVLPPSLGKRRKRGFTLPFPIWMRKDLRPFLEDTFSLSSADKSGLFSGAAVQGIWREFISRSDNRDWSRVWSLGSIDLICEPHAGCA